MFIPVACFYLQGDTTRGETIGDTETPKPAAGDAIQTEVQTTKWRVENSWGEEKDKPGYLMMTDSWFTEFVYEVVVDKKYVPADVMAVVEQQPKVLPAWDPMGSLACILCEKGDHQAQL